MNRRKLEHIHQRLEDIQGELTKFYRDISDPKLERRLHKAWACVDNTLAEIENILISH